LDATRAPSSSRIPLVALEQEGVDLAQELPAEAPLELRETLGVAPRRSGTLLRPGHGKEFVGGLVEDDVLSLPPDACLALENGGALHARNLAGGRPVDPLADPDHVPLALVHEVEPPGLAALVDAITTSGHQESLRGCCGNVDASTFGSSSRIQRSNCRCNVSAQSTTSSRSQSARKRGSK